jgi:hypothetical protein
MNSSHLFLLSKCLIILLGFAQTALAQENPCRTYLKQDVERLRCYDDYFARIDDGEHFGLTVVQQRARVDSVELTRVVSSVVSVTTRADKKRMVKLENGQAWILTESNIALPIANGTEVVLQKAALGSYFLITPSGRKFRAKRHQ